MKSEGTSRVTYEIEPIGDSCRLTVTHDQQLQEGAGNGQPSYGGWPMILSGIKTLLEIAGEMLGTTPGSSACHLRQQYSWAA